MQDDWKTCSLCGNERHAGWKCQHWAEYKNIPCPKPGHVPTQSAIQEKIDDLVEFIQIMRDAKALDKCFFNELISTISEDPTPIEQPTEVHDKIPQGVLFVAV